MSRMSFEQYFIDTSRGYGVGADKMSVPYFEFDEITYKHKDHDHTAHYKVFYVAERDVIQIHFEGTRGDNQWIANFEFPEQYYDSFRTEEYGEITLKVHSGWGAMYKAMKHAVRDAYSSLHELHPSAKVEIIGWSLGSSQAVLCAQDLAYNFGVKSYVYTYGSVKPFYGFDRKIRAYLASCCAEAYNFYDHNDVVGYMVPFCGYFTLNHVKVKQDSFCIAKLFNPGKYHTEYWKESLYNIVS